MELKKIQPYPIIVKLLKVENSPPISGQIRKLTSVGFMVDIENFFLKVGEEFKCDFSIPISHFQIHEAVKVVKTLDRFKDITTKDKIHIIELHFKSLSSEGRKAISQFTSSINQTEK